MVKLVCAIKSCTSNSKNIDANGQPMLLYKFPTDPKLLVRWILCTGRGQNWKPTEDSGICYKHFQKNCFTMVNNKQVLSPNAAPSILPPEAIANIMREKKITVKHENPTNSSVDRTSNSTQRSTTYGPSISNDHKYSSNQVLKRKSSNSLAEPEIAKKPKAEKSNGIESNVSISTNFNDSKVQNTVKNVKITKIERFNVPEKQKQKTGKHEEETKMPVIAVRSTKSLTPNVKTATKLLTVSPNQKESANFLTNEHANSPSADNSKPLAKYLNQFLDFVDEYKNDSKSAQSTAEKKIPIAESSPKVKLIKPLQLNVSPKNLLPIAPINCQVKNETSELCEEALINEYNMMEDVEYLDEEFNHGSDIELDKAEEDKPIEEKPEKNHIEKQLPIQTKNIIKKEEDKPEEDHDKNQLPSQPITIIKKPIEIVNKPISIGAKENEETNKSNDINVTTEGKEHESDYSSDDFSSEYSESDCSDIEIDFVAKCTDKVEELVNATYDILNQLKSLKSDLKKYETKQLLKKPLSTPAANSIVVKLPFKSDDEFLKINSQNNETYTKALLNLFNKSEDKEWTEFVKQNLSKLISEPVRLQLKKNPQFNCKKSSIIDALTKCTNERFPSILRFTIRKFVENLIRK